MEEILPTKKNPLRATCLDSPFRRVPRFFTHFPQDGPLLVINRGVSPHINGLINGVLIGGSNPIWLVLNPHLVVHLLVI